MYINFEDPKNAEAWITLNKGRRSVKNSKVYLKNGDNFEIELYNPKHISVLARIKINNVEISSGGLVIRPGQRVYLDCFIDTKKKFTFNTYEVEDNLSAKAAISYNGDVEVYFYDEFIPMPPVRTYISKGWNLYDPNDTLGGGGPSFMDNVFRSSSTNIVDLSNSTYTTTNLTPENVSSTYSVNTLNDTIDKYLSDVKTGTIETGKIEGGEKSDQKFVSVDQQFNSYACNSYFFKLMPESTKPAEVKDIVRYCTECGKKAKKNDKFCGGCGTKH